MGRGRCPLSCLNEKMARFRAVLAPIWHVLMTGEYPANSTANQKRILRRQRPSYKIEDGKLYYKRKDWVQVVTTPEEVQEFMKYYHVTIGCHMGIGNTRKIISAKYYWFGMAYDIMEYVTDCPTCQSCRTKNMKTTPPLKKQEMETQPTELEGLDLTDDDQKEIGAPLKSTSRRNVRKNQTTPSDSGDFCELKEEYFESSSFMLPSNNCEPTSIPTDSNVQGLTTPPAQSMLSSNNCEPTRISTDSNVQGLTTPPTQSFMLSSNNCEPTSIPTDSKHVHGFTLETLEASTSSDDDSSSHISTSSSSYNNSPIRKRRKKNHSSDSSSFNETLNKVDTILNTNDRGDDSIRAANDYVAGLLNTNDRGDDIVRATNDYVAGFMNLLSRKEKKVVHLKIVQLLQNHPITLDSMAE